MSDPERISPERAQELLAEGYVYVDVRSEPEFEAGHVPGALNVPLMQRGAGGLVENPDFLAVMQSAFSREEPLIVGCKSGARSLRAARALLGAGFTRVLDLRTGFDGTKDAFGRLDPGWGRKGLPVETGNPEGQRYEDVKQRTPR